MTPGGPRLASRRGRNIVIAFGASIALALSGLGLQSASASIRSMLAVSLSPDRSTEVRLDGSTVKGEIYVFVPNSRTLKQVEFYLDDTHREKPPIRTDTVAPFDFAGTATDGTALPYDTTKLAGGSHTIRAVLTWSNGSTSSRRGNFTVTNSGATATPSASLTAPTTAPTASTGSPTAPNTTMPATSAAAPTTRTATPTTTPLATSTPTTQTPTSKPSQSSTGPTPGATTPASPAASCLSGGGVAIGVGDDARSVVNAHGAGTTYIVKAGTHLQNFSVQPKSGDRFCGEPGAVLDGGRSLAFAFSGGGTNVTLDSLTIQNYNPGFQNGAIKPYIRATGWVLRNLTVQKNMYLGVNASDGMKILGGHYNYNEQMGIGGNDGHVIGVTLDGLDANPATYDGPELAFNKVLHDPCDYGGGGAKFDGDNIVVRNVWAHDNDCMGIWFDINAVHNLVEYNKVENNAAEGIFYEISQDACIRHNVVTNNGHGYRSDWYWSSGIGNSGSFNVEIYGNTLTNNFNGIAGIQQTRTDSTPPQHLVDHFYVHNNTVSGSGINGLGTGNGTNFSTRDVVFQNNTFLNGAQSFTRTGTGYQACSLLGFGTN
jgi:hypothetical protein